MKIGITGVHAGCNRSPGLAVAKALHYSSNVDIVAIDYDNLSTGLYLPIFKAVEVFSWSTDLKKLLDRILAVHHRHQLDVLIPCLNNDVGPISELAPKLKSIGINTLLPPKISVDARNKIDLSRLVEQVGLRYPETVVCSSEDDLEAALTKIGCPCVIKGPECGVFPVRSKELFNYYATYCATSFGFPILVQEWMEGEEFCLFSLCDSSSKIWGNVVAKKLGIADDGESWMSVLVDGTEFEVYMERIVELLGWIGPIECDILKRDDDLFLLDVNPRFPAWIDGLAEAGCNPPLLAIQLAQELVQPTPLEVPVGMILCKDFEDICFPIDSMITE